MLQGIGAGALPTVAYVAIGRQYAPQARPRMFALLSTAWVVPVGDRPRPGGRRRRAVRVALGVPRAWCRSSACAASRCWARSATSPRPDAPLEEVSSLRDALLTALGAGLTLAGLAESRWYVAVPMVAVGLAVLVPAFRRLTPPGTLRARRGLAAAVLIRGVLTFSFFQADAYVPLSLTSVKGVSTIFAGVVLTAASLTWTAGSWVQERRVARDGPRPLVRYGFVAVGVGIGLMMVTLLAGVPAGARRSWPGASAGFGIGLSYAPISLTTLALAEPGREGSATASLQLSDVLGTALGTGIGGVVIATGDRHDWSLRPTLLVIYAMALDDERRRRAAGRATPAPPRGPRGGARTSPVS